MLKIETYKEKLRKLEEKYKDNKNSKYFKERVDLMVSDLSLKFPEEIATNIKRMAIDLTNGDDEYIYPHEVGTYFIDKVRNVNISPSYRFDKYIQNEANYFVSKNKQDYEVGIIDLQFLLEQLNELNSEALKLGIIKSKNNSIYGEPIHYFLKKAKEKCCEHIERLYIEKKHRYRELERYCTQHIIEIKDISSSYGYKYVISPSDYEYLDDRISLPKVISGCIGDELWSMARRWNITKLEKFSWDYYIYAFEYLRSFYIKYINKYVKDYLEDIRDDTFYSFTNILIFFITRAKSKCYQFDLKDTKKGLNFEFEINAFFNKDNNKANRIRINFMRYFWCNFKYLYNSICENNLFTDAQKIYLKKCIENVLEEIAETLYTEGWL